MTAIDPEFLRRTVRVTGASRLQVEQTCRQMIEGGILALDAKGVPYPLGEASVHGQLEEIDRQLMVERRTEILTRMRRR